MPSPRVVCSRMMTWPLFSPPRPAPDTSIASRMYLSPTGVRTTRPPARMMAASSPPLDSTRHDAVPPRQGAARQPVEGDDADQPVTVDDLAALVDGHAPVGVAVERDARGRRRSRDRVGQRWPGAVAPQSRLMLMPSGWLKWTSPRAGAPQDLGRDDSTPNRWRSRGRAAVAARPAGHPEAVLAVSRRAPAGRRCHGRGRRWPGRAARPRARSAPRARPRSRRRASARRVEHLEAVVVGRVVRRGDHDARRRIRRPARGGPGRRRADAEAVGVHTHCVAPATMAATSMSPERRVSWPTNNVWPAHHMSGGRPAQPYASGGPGPRWPRRVCRRCQRACPSAAHGDALGVDDGAWTVTVIFEGEIVTTCRPPVGTKSTGTVCTPTRGRRRRRSPPVPWHRAR